MSKNKKSVTASRDLTPEEVLERFSDGPQTGIFTDGSARPNPGPGGWGVVFVKDGRIIATRSGYEPDTTNNRMELIALIEAYKLIDPEEEVTIYSDSELCVKTLTEWAPGWEKNGWRRKSGPIKNLELVKELYALYNSHPRATLKWIEAHNGWRWNEYADALATSWIKNNQ
ncbi:MAG: ribonuclease HI [Candidatus Dadabacteria bacterium]|nr:MAG: ribonuclease HI [Candidatus Dadabacteria bacterium]